ncbi:MAG: hypothetical protein H7067_03600 [Burkholderiales bacterium]|nr:hypothetical protein [Opitutaceae bacterium]
MKTFNSLALLTWALGCTVLHADVLELKDGTILNGKYAGGTTTSVRFEDSTGLQVIETSKIVALTFTAPATAAAVSPAPVPVTTTAPATPATAAAQPTSVTLPANTTLLVRMVDTVTSQSPAGTKFATKLETDVAAPGGVALKAGTVVYGKVHSSTQAKRATGKSTLDLRLVEVVVNSQAVPITSSGFQEAGASSLKKVAKGAAAGAVIGEAADDDAGKGAAIGASASLLKKGEGVSVPTGALLEFTLSKPVTIQVAP